MNESATKFGFEFLKKPYTFQSSLSPNNTYRLWCFKFLKTLFKVQISKSPEKHFKFQSSKLPKTPCRIQSLISAKTSCRFQSSNSPKYHAKFKVSNLSENLHASNFKVPQNVLLNSKFQISYNDLQISKSRILHLDSQIPKIQTPQKAIQTSTTTQVKKEAIEMLVVYVLLLNSMIIIKGTHVKNALKLILSFGNRFRNLELNLVSTHSCHKFVIIKMNIIYLESNVYDKV